MKKNIVIVFGGALLVAFLVTMAVQMSLSGNTAPAPQVQQEARVEILVATKDLSMGRELKSGDLRWQSWPKATVFSGAVVRANDENAIDALSGRLRRNVSEGEPVLRNALLQESKGNFVAASLDPGMRAVAIKVSAESMVGGFLDPGDFVDVILTYKETIRTETDEDPRVKKLIELNLNKFATETILERVRVLAIDQKAKRPEDESKIKVGKTVTLGVDARGAEKLALAGQLGELTLSLRGIGDENVAEFRPPAITDARLTSIGDELFQKAQELKNQKGLGSRNTLRIYNGNAMSSVSVQ